MYVNATNEYRYLCVYYFHWVACGGERDELELLNEFIEEFMGLIGDA